MLKTLKTLFCFTFLFSGDFQTTHVTNNDERQHALEQQQIGHVEKNKKLKEQYSKLQLLQKRQRLVSLSCVVLKVIAVGLKQGSNLHFPRKCCLTCSAE